MESLKKELFEKIETFVCDGKVQELNEILEFINGIIHIDDNLLLSRACDSGNLAIIKLLVEYGADVNSDDGYPLYTCAYHNFDECVEYLLKEGANPEKVKNTCGYDNLCKILGKIKKICPHKRTHDYVCDRDPPVYISNCSDCGKSWER